MAAYTEKAVGHSIRPQTPPQMNKRDFEYIADCLREYGAGEEMIRHFAKKLAKTNGEFKECRFIERCLVSPSQNT